VYIEVDTEGQERTKTVGVQSSYGMRVLRMITGGSPLPSFKPIQYANVCASLRRRPDDLNIRPFIEKGL
jgi:hypothetical protein